MSERKVLTKYYPPDFDPSKLVRTRTPRGDVPAGPKVQTVRLMAPFSMKCTSCGEYIYKGRKFNARKETTDEKYYAISIFRFYIRCTRCSAEITFKTDPKGMDYTCERGAKRNFEVWRAGGATPAGETDEERLDRLEAEMGEKSAMEELEAKVVDAKQEMAIADALDEIRTRNARNERAAAGGEVGGVDVVEEEMDAERRRGEREDEEMARRAFMTEMGEKVRRIGEGEGEEEEGSEALVATKGNKGLMLPPPLPSSAVPTFKRVVKKKKDLGAALGIKKKPALV
ncbi:Pre-mRNA-splicing factor cwf16 [Xanthoria parietina]